MNVLQDASAPNLNERESLESSAKPPIPKPAKPLSPSQEELTQRVLEGVKRMATDEAYRLEIARKLS